MLLFVVALLVVGCSQSSGAGASADGAPAKEGNQLTYHLAKTDRRQKTVESELVLTFLPDGQLGVGADKKAVTTLDSELAPVDGQPLSESDLGLLYLPPVARKPNASTRAGMVQFQKQWNRWSCWVVNVRDGDLSGQRYYDSRTGMLVGFELNLDDPDASRAYFHKAILTRSDVAGL